MISANSIALHVALSEGVTIAWWYRASRAGVTLRELHDTWVMGTSTIGVLFSGKRFNYVAMGTLFVATIPLNGFLLQSAVALEASTKSNTTTLFVPLAGRLPSGFSAEATNGTVDSWSDDFVSVTTSMDGLIAEIPAGVFHTAAINDFAEIGCDNKDHSAVCKSNASITGFSKKCSTNMTRSYDLRPSSHITDRSYTETIYSSSVTWSPTDPNAITLTLLYKPNQTCQGVFEEQVCRFEAANMSVPIQIQTDQGFYAGTDYSNSDSAWPVITIDANSTDTDYMVLNPLPVYSDEGHTNSTYGAMASWLGSRFNGSINWTSTDGIWSTKRSGAYTNTFALRDGIYSQYPNGTAIGDTDSPEGPKSFDPNPDNVTWCQSTYVGLDWLTDTGYDSTYGTTDLPTTIFLTLNEMMLGASAIHTTTQYNTLLYSDATSELTQNWTYDATLAWQKSQLISLSQTIHNANQTQPALRYKIKYKYWGASATITIFIVLMIVPLFWGFWTLDRRTTLSPFETAAAFQARPLDGVDMKRGTNVLLKEIGKRPVHQAAAGFGAAESSCGSSSAAVSEVSLVKQEVLPK